MAPFSAALMLFITLVVTTHAMTDFDIALHEFVARQTFSVPPECDDKCAPLLSALYAPSCSTDIECLCGSDVVSKAQKCAQCEATFTGPGAPESVYQEYATACKEHGIIIPSFTPTSSGGSGPGDSYLNLKVSAACVVGSAALAFIIVA